MQSLQTFRILTPLVSAELGVNITNVTLHISCSAAVPLNHLYSPKLTGGAKISVSVFDEERYLKIYKLRLRK